MKLHSTVLGSGKPLLILHGFLGMSDNWKTVGKLFAEKSYEVHLIDQRNHGKSPHSDAFSYKILAEDIKEYCQQKNLKNYILLGHSMGGKTAMFTACLYPDLVEKLIVVDIAPKYYAPHHQDILKGLAALDKERFTSRSDAEDFLTKFVTDIGTRLFLLKNLYWKTKERLALKLDLDSLIANVENIGAALPEHLKFEKPTLFVNGEKSNYIGETDKEQIQKQFPNVEFVEIKGAGHWVHAENMDDFFTTALKFI